MKIRERQGYQQLIQQAHRIPNVSLDLLIDHWLPNKSKLNQVEASEQDCHGWECKKKEKIMNADNTYKKVNSKMKKGWK
jgi:hypothetical protein